MAQAGDDGSLHSTEEVGNDQIYHILTVKQIEFSDALQTERERQRCQR